MKSHFIKQHVDLNYLPIVDPRFAVDDGACVVVGDLHASGLKNLFNLIGYGFISLQDERDFEQFLFLYYLPIERWDAQCVLRMKEMIERIVCNPQAKNASLIYIGDEVGDRGVLDLINLFLFKKLHESNITFYCLASNHGMELISCYERGVSFAEPVAIISSQRVSASNMQFLIDKKIITREMVNELIEHYYLPHVELLAFTIDSANTMTFYAHAPFGDDTLEALAKQLKTPFDFRDTEKKAISCVAMQSAFRKIRDAKEIHTLYATDTPFHQLLNNRDHSQLKRDNHSRYVNGHHMIEGDESLPLNVYEVDNELGKETFADGVGMQPVYFSHETKQFVSLPLEEFNRWLDNLIKSAKKELRYLFSAEEISHVLLKSDYIYSAYRKRGLTYFFGNNAGHFKALFVFEERDNERLASEFSEALLEHERYILFDIMYFLAEKFILTGDIFSELVYLALNETEDCLESFYQYLLRLDHYRGQYAVLEEKDILSFLDKNAQEVKDDYRLIEAEQSSTVSIKTREQLISDEAGALPDKLKLCDFIREVILLHGQGATAQANAHVEDAIRAWTIDFEPVYILAARLDREPLYLMTRCAYLNQIECINFLVSLYRMYPREKLLFLNVSQLENIAVLSTLRLSGAMNVEIHADLLPFLFSCHPAVVPVLYRFIKRTQSVDASSHLMIEFFSSPTMKEYLQAKNTASVQDCYMQFIKGKVHAHTEVQQSAVALFHNMQRFSSFLAERLKQPNLSKAQIEEADHSYLVLQTLYGKVLKEFIVWTYYSIYDAPHNFLSNHLLGTLTQALQEMQALPLFEQSRQVKPIDAVASSHDVKDKASLPSIHFTWIGSPNPKVLAQDVCGPIAMAKMNQENPIYFWCLEKHVGHYVALLSTYHITVCSIESLIKDNMQHPDVRFAQMTKDFKYMYGSTFSNNATTVSVRDLIVIKNAFCFYLLALKGGYAFDTNILPQKKQVYRDLDSFYVPAEYVENTMRLKAKQLECWIMYAPTGQNDTVLSMFQDCFAIWLFAKSEYSANIKHIAAEEKFYEVTGHTSIYPIYHAYCHEKIKVWSFRALNDDFSMASLDALSVQKTYSNTHKYSKREQYDAVGVSPLHMDELFYYVLTNNSLMLNVLIQLHNQSIVQFDCNKQSPSVFYDEENKILVYAGETLLHLAIRLKHDRCKALLENMTGIDMTLKAVYPKGKLTPSELLGTSKSAQLSVASHQLLYKAKSPAEKEEKSVKKNQTPQKPNT